LPTHIILFEKREILDYILKEVVTHDTVNFSIGALLVKDDKNQLVLKSIIDIFGKKDA